MAGFLLPGSRITSFEEHLATETGGLGLHRAVEIGPQAVLDVVDRSGLRGRGGAGFPTGRKWRSVLGQAEGHRYLVCNAAEGEPSTFKDRALLRRNPYQVVEGLLIAALALDVREVFVALKAASTREYDALVSAVAEVQAAGICEACPITIVRGPDEYLFGEERAMLEVIEGRDPLPRLFPPYEHGLFATDIRSGWEAVGSAGLLGRANPTVVNNVETICNLPHIVARGADWFRSFGTEASPGTVVCTVVGDVARPSVAEVELGTPLAAAIELVAGGPASDTPTKAVVPGASAPVLHAGLLDVPLTHEDMRAAGSALGSVGFFVVDEDTCMVEVARLFSSFLAVASCGQCPPCTRGSAEITSRLNLIEAGGFDAAVLDELDRWIRHVTDANRCSLGRQEQDVVSSVLRTFPDEVEEHRAGRCPRPKPVRFPKLEDLEDGAATYAEPASLGFERAVY